MHLLNWQGQSPRPETPWAGQEKALGVDTPSLPCVSLHVAGVAYASRRPFESRTA